MAEENMIVKHAISRCVFQVVYEAASTRLPGSGVRPQVYWNLEWGVRGNGDGQLYRATMRALERLEHTPRKKRTPPHPKLKAYLKACNHAQKAQAISMMPNS
jgi:hypothetical protein